MRIMYLTGKAAQVAAEITNYKLALLGTTVTRLTQIGQRRIPTGELGLIALVRTRRRRCPHTVEARLSRVAQRSLIRWDAHGQLIITASFKKKKENQDDVILCYTPTNDSDGENSYKRT